MQVQVHITVVASAIVHDSLDHSPVGGRGHGGVTVMLVAATKPIVLVDGQADDVAMPNVHRFRDDRDVIRHGDTTDGGRGPSGPRIPSGAVFQTRDIHAPQAHRTVPAGGDDLVTGDLQLGRGGGGLLGKKGQGQKECKREGTRSK